MPSRIIPLTLTLVFAVVSLLSAAKPSGQEQVYKEVDGRKLKLYVTKPDGWQKTDNRPAVVFFHGGGWVGGAPGQFTEHSKYLAERGMVAIQVEYRLLDRKSNDPPTQCVEDALDAMRWVRSHATDLGIDPNRIAAAGGSAGGHLAAYLGTVSVRQSGVSTKPNAMILFNPVYDNGPGGWGTQRVKDRYTEFSPAHNISEDDPPHIVYLGSQDKLIPVATAENFQKKMKEAGVTSELRIYEGQGHGFFNHGKDNNRWYDATIEETDKFLTSLGWLEPKTK
ncbi:alpha/beta hydrolase [Bremerella cremea]|uniref:Lipase n=1 Tax=Blastopirellula marina TaxID=124 RepID=A0A2S8FQB8_9BACT|nr:MULTISPECIES: alpha/beta hydrolase [Pirellulaceae]PQO34373.1 lipase [Blastopirellula marina]RCS46869.1 alpha/beta hydrolase [Bremerella cremea]